MIKRQYIKTTEDFKDNMGANNDLVILTYSDETITDKYSVTLSGTLSVPARPWCAGADPGVVRGSSRRDLKVHRPRPGPDR